MDKLSTRVVLQLCHALDPLQKKVFLTTLLQHDEPPEDLYPGEALSLWVFDMLRKETTLSDTVLLCVVRAFYDNLAKYGEAVGAAYAANVPPPQGRDNWLPEDRKAALARGYRELPELKLGLVGQYWATVDGADFFLELSSGNRTGSIGHVPLRTTTFNLSVLFVEKMEAYHHARRPKPA